MEIYQVIMRYGSNQGYEQWNREEVIGTYRDKDDAIFAYWSTRGQWKCSMQAGGSLVEAKLELIKDGDITDVTP